AGAGRSHVRDRPHVEAEILGALSERFRDTTVVLVASRMATIAAADEVVYLEAGGSASTAPTPRCSDRTATGG
ncbi:hypothetical protein, partial [Streptomyces sp. MNU103]|uniref:hypothetical protein n=1 Tax=Streptomyces sp. MNU103 TaxID=2560024 RepID=UPI001E5F204D|nr:hypothetical protein [Streptomyces sp. MNU103]